MCIMCERYEKIKTYRRTSKEVVNGIDVARLYGMECTANALSVELDDMVRRTQKKFMQYTDEIVKRIEEADCPSERAVRYAVIHKERREEIPEMPIGEWLGYIHLQERRYPGFIQWLLEEERGSKENEDQ